MTTDGACVVLRGRFYVHRAARGLGDVRGDGGRDDRARSWSADGVYSDRRPADVQQKMRVAADAIQHDLSVAGAGSALPTGGGALAQFLPAIRPSAGIAGDSASVRTGPRDHSLHAEHERGSRRCNRNERGMSVGGAPTCAVAAACGFQRDMRAVVFDRTGPGLGYDVFTVADASGAFLTRATDEGSFSTTYTSTATSSKSSTIRTTWIDRMRRTSG